MKKSFTKFLGAIVLAAGLLAAPEASAVIAGGISFTGFSQDLDDDDDYTNATVINSFGALVFAGGGTGSFSAVSGGPVAFLAPLTFSPGYVVQGAPLWTFGGFSFTLDSIGSVNATQNSLELDGLGTVTDGVDSVPLSWIATFNRATGTSSFSVSQSTNIPEGGSALALLGLGLVGIAGARRLKAVKA